MHQTKTPKLIFLENIEIPFFLILSISRIFSPLFFFLHPDHNMERGTRQKIEEAVKDILSKTDMDEMTEFKIRVKISERLGIDLSDFIHKKLIREAVESFLLSTADENGDGRELNSKHQEEQAKETVKVKKEIDGDGDRLICKVQTIHFFFGSMKL